LQGPPDPKHRRYHGWDHAPFRDASWASGRVQRRPVRKRRPRMILLSCSPSQARSVGEQTGITAWGHWRHCAPSRWPYRTALRSPWTVVGRRGNGSHVAPSSHTNTGLGRRAIGEKRRADLGRPDSPTHTPDALLQHLEFYFQKRTGTRPGTRRYAADKQSGYGPTPSSSTRLTLQNLRPSVGCAGGEMQPTRRSECPHSCLAGPSA
jgi:hypothetical protein